MSRRFARYSFTFVLPLCFLVAPVVAQESLLEQFEEKVTAFTLDNGLTFVVVERHDAPVVSFHTYANVGAVDDPKGASGMAHLFEHMAFKGTASIGTENVTAELEAMRLTEQAFLKLRRERAMGPRADTARIHRLEEELQAAIERTEQYSASDEYTGTLERNGVQGLNAYTGTDQTGYIYSLPANKLELFFALEADRFMHPVLREFYTERDVVMEERRLRTGSRPVGRLVEEFLVTAFKAHPYGVPGIGHMSDLESISRTEARAFFEKYYGPENLTIGIAGDVDPARVRTLAEQYFGPLEGAEPPIRITTEEPEQIAERRVIIHESTQPFLLIGYHRPSMYDEDAVVYDVLQDVLARGRTSRFHDALVETEQAVQVQAIPSFPGEKYPTLFALFAVPTRGVAPDSLEEDVYAVLDAIKEEGITREELERAKTRARADLIGSLDANMGLAQRFSRIEALTGDWRNVFRYLERLQGVSVADVQRVARETFQRENRTVAMIKTAEEEPTTAQR